MINKPLSVLYLKFNLRKLFKILRYTKNFLWLSVFTKYHRSDRIFNLLLRGYSLQSNWVILFYSSVSSVFLESFCAIGNYICKFEQRGNLGVGCFKTREVLVHLPVACVTLIPTILCSCWQHFSVNFTHMHDVFTAKSLNDWCIIIILGFLMAMSKALFLKW